MAFDIQISTAAKNAACDAITALLNVGGAGTIKVYDGTKPAGPNTAITSQVLGVTLTFSATSFGAASSGVATANAITSGSPAANITASWYRACNNAGTAVIDGTVGTSGCDLNLGSTTITTGVPVAITSATYTHP